MHLCYACIINIYIETRAEPVPPSYGCLLFGLRTATELFCIYLHINAFDLRLQICPKGLSTIFQHLIQTKMEDRMSTFSGTVTDAPVSSSKERVVASKRKNPPPESIENIRTRSHIILSFWSIIIFLGLPIWWWTTSIHRARLPLRDMLEWADGKVFSPCKRFP